MDHIGDARSRIGLNAAKGHGHQDDMVGVEAWIHLAQGHERADQECCSNQQNHRQGNFRDDDKGMRSLASHSCTLTAVCFTQQVFKSPAANDKGGDQAEDQRGQQRNSEREAQYAPIESKTNIRFPDVRKSIGVRHQ